MKICSSLFSAGMLLLALPAAAANVSAGDRAFVREAMDFSVGEVQRALSQVNTEDNVLRQYAQKIEGDHQRENYALAAIASDLQLDTGSVSPERLNPEVQTTTGPAGVHPAPRAAMPVVPYFKTEIATHKQAIALFQREARTGGNARLRTFAKQQLPTLNEHLHLAQRDLAQEQRAHP